MTANNTHTRLTALFPGLPRWAGTRKGKTNLDFTGARDSEWQWHQLGHTQVCTLLQTDTTPAPHHSVFYRPDALPAAQPTANNFYKIRRIFYSIAEEHYLLVSRFDSTWYITITNTTEQNTQCSRQCREQILRIPSPTPRLKNSYSYHYHSVSQYSMQLLLRCNVVLCINTVYWQMGWSR